ncbi:MAG: LanC-like protein [Rubrivivax sp.]|nr:LanC-like protein [Rubrivivax sp.]MDP3615220.1 LanC-like protein [Rubrivivax sp.]
MTTHTALYGPERHEPLAGEPWNEGAARAAIQHWVAAALSAFDPARGWSAHPREDGGPPGEPLCELYGGAGGAIWALEHLAQAGASDKRWDFSHFVQGLAAQQVAAVEGSQHGTASFLIGESGLLLLQWKLTHDEAAAQRLFEVVQGNLQNPVREQLWGSSGSVLAAIAMAEHTGDARWAGLVQRAVQILWDEMETLGAAGGTWGWVQNLYGRVETLIGAGHGFVGNVYPAVRGAAFITPQLRDAFAARALAFLQATALRDGNCVNWWPRVPAVSPANKPPLVQDCHGAAGIVCRLAPLPRSVPDAPAWDLLLQQAGELTWRAGPLAKGVAFCHGTAGNAHAFLHLFARTGDERWLERARAFAMHGIVQVEQERAVHGQGRHTLWTGDLGMACVLWDCISGRPGFPTLDRF